MKRTSFLICTLMVLSTLFINLNLLYGLSLYIVPLIMYSFVLILYKLYLLNWEGVDGRSDLYLIVLVTFTLWFSMGFLIGFGLNIMIVLPFQYLIILMYRMTQLLAIEAVRRVFLNKFIGLNVSLTKLIGISTVVMLFSVTYSKLIGFNISYFPEFIVLFINSLVLTTVGYFYDYKGQVVLSLLNGFIFSLSPILLDVSGTIKYMLESFVIFTQFLIIYYLNTINNEFKQSAEFIIVSKFKKVIGVFIKVMSKITFVLAIILMISFLLGFRTLAIVSNSMNPTISRGDIVFIDINNHEIIRGDIIAFTQGDKIVIHRVYKIDEASHTILTKGDANQNIDPWIVTDKNYIGKYMFSIPLLGFPSIYLSSLLTSPVIGISFTVTLILALIIITLMKEMVYIVE